MNIDDLDTKLQEIGRTCKPRIGRVPLSEFDRYPTQAKIREWRKERKADGDKVVNKYVAWTLEMLVREVRKQPQYMIVTHDAHDCDGLLVPCLWSYTIGDSYLDHAYTSAGNIANGFCPNDCIKIVYSTSHITMAISARIGTLIRAGLIDCVAFDVGSFIENTEIMELKTFGDQMSMMGIDTIFTNVRIGGALLRQLFEAWLSIRRASARASAIEFDIEFRRSLDESDLQPLFDICSKGTSGADSLGK